MAQTSAVCDSKTSAVILLFVQINVTGGEMARPRKGEEKARPERVTWRISSAVKEGLEQLAKARSENVSDVAHDLLEQGVKRELAKARKP